MPVLKLASCMAENGEPFCQNVAAYIQAKLSIQTDYVSDIPWQSASDFSMARKAEQVSFAQLVVLHHSRQVLNNKKGGIDRWQI